MPNVQSTPRLNTLIIVYVKPIGITQQNKLDHILIADSSADSANDTGANVVNYESNVKKGGNITWVGVVWNPAAAPNYYVILCGINNSNGGNQIDGLNNISHEPSQPGGTHMNARVAANPNVNEVDYTITLHLHKIENGVDTYEVFTIDPRLKIH